MRLTQYILPAAVVYGASFNASAQLITDATAATAARDSLFQQVTTTRQQIEQKSRIFTVKAPNTGARRLVVRGYYAGNPAAKAGTSLAWKHVIKHYRNGSSREQYTAYFEGRKVAVQERRHNSQLTWLSLQNYQLLNLLQLPSPKLSGSYTATAYVRWNGKNYLLPARLPRP